MGAINDMKNIKEYVLNFCPIVIPLFAIGLAMYIPLTHEITPNGGYHFAHGQTGPTGPTGPTGATGATGSQGTVNNHTLFGGSAPTLSNCGTSPTNTNAVDNKGIVTVGANSIDNLGHVVPVLQCTMTFATAFTVLPAATFSTDTKGLYVTFAGLSTTVVTVYFNKDASRNRFSYTAF